MGGFGPSRTDEMYETAMRKGQEALDNGSPVESREWLEVAQQARRLKEMERLSHMGRGADFLVKGE